jgi:hypothetical protein
MIDADEAVQSRDGLGARGTRLDMRLGRLMACVWIASVVTGAAHADDQGQSNDLTRDQLARVIAVLRLQPAAAGQSCLDALHEAHQTEDQLKLLQTKKNNPDLALAQDVLETDYENAKEICGADANRVCAASERAANLDAACTALRQTARNR